MDAVSSRSAPLAFLFLAALAAALGGCGGDDDDRPRRPPQAPLALADGTEVRVGSRGGVSLVAGGREFFATADGPGPALRYFTERVLYFPGMWDFERAEERSVPLDRFLGVTATGGGVLLRFASEDGAAEARLTLSTLRPGAVTRLELAVTAPAAPTAVGLPVRCDRDGGFYGFGEQYTRVDQRGEAFTLFVSEQGLGRDPAKPKLPVNGGPHTTYFPMPYYLDPRGFGVLVRTARRVDVDLCRTDPGVAWLEPIDAGPVELLVFHGPRPLDVIRQLGDELGRPPVPPEWAFRLWVAAQGGTDVVRERAAALRAHDVPASALWVQDWTGVRPNVTGGFGVQYRWTADAEHYPDLAGLIAGLRQEGFRFLGYANPFVDVALGHYEPMASAGWLVKNRAGRPFVILAPNGRSAHPDFTIPAAREYVKGFLRAMVRDYGMDGWMADFAEWLPLGAVVSDGTDPVVAHNTYPVAWQRVSREVLEELRPDGDWVMFARSGFTGVQGVAQIVWAGDQETSFDPHDGLPTVVPALLNLGISGVPLVTHDIGGFSSVGTPPRTKEVFLRWTELGAFTPFMRTHEGDRKFDNWQWHSDAETIAHFRRFARIHDLLVPEFLALAREAARTSAPILRHLALVFPDDPGSRGVDDQFLIGESLLVAPVVEEGATRRRLYLPPGEWYDVWSGARVTGPRTLEVDAPVGRPPVFSRGADRRDLRSVE